MQATHLIHNNTFSVTISGLVIKITAPKDIELTERFIPFITNKKPDYTAEFSATNTLPTFNEKPICKTNTINIIRTDTGYARQFVDICDNSIYAVGNYDLENKKCEIIYLKEKEHYLKTDLNYFMHIALECFLLYHNRLTIHSASVLTEKGAILFAGISGAGKSTQADLWQIYENAEILNGDRNIIYSKKGIWTASGSPYAGSSEIYKDKQEKIAAIVLVKKSQNNEVRCIEGIEKFKMIFPHITVNVWDKEYVNKAFTLTMDLLNQIPVFELSCTKDKSAVEVLKLELWGENS